MLQTWEIFYSSTDDAHNCLKKWIRKPTYRFENRIFFDGSVFTKTKSEVEDKRSQRLFNATPRIVEEGKSTHTKRKNESSTHRQIP